MTSITNKLRKINAILFKPIVFPNNVNMFLNELNAIQFDNENYLLRSYKAYKINNIYSDRMPVLKNLRTFLYGFGFIVYLLKCLACHKPNKIENKSVVYYKISNNDNIIPNFYLDSDSFVVCDMIGGMYLDKEAFKILKECLVICRGNLAFLFQVLFPLGNYSYIVNKYNPNEIITTYESLPTVSILTYYCRQKGVKHINFMHGEKILSQNNTMGVFDVMYVWDEYYVELFKKLKYLCKSYIIYNPWIVQNLPEKTEKIDYTFYLNYEDTKTLHKIAGYADSLISKGNIVKVRPHPSQYDEVVHKRLLPASILENSRDIPILQSIANANTAVSRFSTVLFQAFSYGKRIVIDDCSNKKEYEKLKSTGYIMFSKKHELLSEEIKKP